MCKCISTSSFKADEGTANVSIAFSAEACQLVDYLVSGDTGITTFSATICKKAVRILRMVISSRKIQ